MVELYGNLTHASNQLGRLGETELYWKEALVCCQLFNNIQQTAEVLFNLADIYDQLNQYSPALEKSSAPEK